MSKVMCTTLLTQLAVFTISGTAKIYTNVYNDSRLNADGGEIFGEVTNAVKNWSSAVIAGTEGAARQY